MAFICSSCEAQCDDVTETQDGILCAKCADGYIECSECGQLVSDLKACTHIVFPRTYDRQTECWDEEEEATFCPACWADRKKRKGQRACYCRNCKE